MLLELTSCKTMVIHKFGMGKIRHNVEFIRAHYLVGLCLSWLCSACRNCAFVSKAGISLKWDIFTLHPVLMGLTVDVQGSWHDVLRLDVQMDNPVGMDMSNSWQDLRSFKRLVSGDMLAAIVPQQSWPAASRGQSTPGSHISRDLSNTNRTLYNRPPGCASVTLGHHLKAVASGQHPHSGFEAAANVLVQFAAGAMICDLAVWFKLRFRNAYESCLGGNHHVCKCWRLSCNKELSNTFWYVKWNHYCLWQPCGLLIGYTVFEDPRLYFIENYGSGEFGWCLTRTKIVERCTCLRVSTAPLRLFEVKMECSLTKPKYPARATATPKASTRQIQVLCMHGLRSETVTVAAHIILQLYRVACCVLTSGCLVCVLSQS